jgi:hypothetical protein
MNLTNTRLKAVSGQLSWSPAVEILVVSGFIARTYPSLDPDQFATATSAYAHKTGLPVELIIKILCGLIDDTESVLPAGSISPFAEYLGAVLSESRKLTTASGTAEVVPPITITMSAAVTSDIDNALKSNRPLTDVELGDNIIRCCIKINNNHKLYLDVINAEPTPAMSVTITQHKKTIYRHRPIRLKQWSELKSVDGVKVLEMSWPTGGLNLHFSNH